MKLRRLNIRCRLCSQFVLICYNLKSSGVFIILKPPHRELGCAYSSRPPDKYRLLNESIAVLRLFEIVLSQDSLGGYLKISLAVNN